MLSYSRPCTVYIFTLKISDSFFQEVCGKNTEMKMECIYSKPSLIQLQLIRIEVWKILYTVEYILQKAHRV
jgi:hypothetical protein